MKKETLRGMGTADTVGLTCIPSVHIFENKIFHDNVIVCPMNVLDVLTHFHSAEG